MLSSPSSTGTSTTHLEVESILSRSTHVSAGVLGMTSMTYAPEVTSGKSVVLPFNSFARLQKNEEKSFIKSTTAR